jgi:hypothetical protein
MVLSKLIGSSSNVLTGAVSQRLVRVVWKGAHHCRRQRNPEANRTLQVGAPSRLLKKSVSVVI